MAGIPQTMLDSRGDGNLDCEVPAEKEVNAVGTPQGWKKLCWVSCWLNLLICLNRKLSISLFLPIIYSLDVIVFLHHIVMRKTGRMCDKSDILELHVVNFRFCVCGDGMEWKRFLWWWAGMGTKVCEGGNVIHEDGCSFCSRAHLYLDRCWAWSCWSWFCWA